jgi:ABC-type glycerol-3-phosphate transport system substrate-binding protein
VKDSEQAEAAKHLVRFFNSPSVAELVRATGLDPASP